MDIKDIMEIDVENLKHKQLEALKKHVMDRLNEIINLVINEEFDEVEKYLKYSPAGDGYGCDNYFIDFSYVDGEEMDLSELLYKMKQLT